MSQGFSLNPPNLCSASLFNVLACYPTDISPQPKLVVISSNGLTDAGHAALPFVIKPLFSIALKSPHADKLVMESMHLHRGLLNIQLLTRFRSYLSCSELAMAPKRSRKNDRIFGSQL